MIDISDMVKKGWEDSTLKVHITNIHGHHFASTALKAQNRTADIAERALEYRELGIYCYDARSDSPQMLASRLDGIIASVGYDDIVIFQYPTWNDIRFDKMLIRRLSQYKGLKKIFFVHDVLSLMFEDNRYLMGEHIDFFNQADLIILPSQRMADTLCAEGLRVKKIIIQKMWDLPVAVDQTVTPKFKKVINFAGNPDMRKFEFVKEWNYDTVELRGTAETGEWAKGKNISSLGWFNVDTFLVNALRSSGGFGLLWSDDPYWCEYMKMNANYKLSAYLAAGIPVIVNENIAESDTIVRKNLGLSVESMDEAVGKIESMSEKQYNEMVVNVALFSNLIRDGYFAKKCLTDAVFQLLCD